MSKPPYDRETIIGVVEWLNSQEHISLVWYGENPADEEEWVNPMGCEIDGGAALEIIADPVRFQANLDREHEKQQAEERYLRSLEPPAMRRLRSFNETRQQCQGMTPKGRHCQRPVAWEQWDDPATFDPDRPEHRFCPKHLPKAGEVQS